MQPCLEATDDFWRPLQSWALTQEHASNEEALCSYPSEATSLDSTTLWPGFSIFTPTSQASWRLAELTSVQCLRHREASAVCP